MPVKGQKLLDPNYDHFSEGSPSLYESTERDDPIQKLWESIYYDDTGQVDKVTGPIAAVIDDVLPGIPFVDIFPDPPDEPELEGVRNLAIASELAAITPSVIKGSYKMYPMAKEFVTGSIANPKAGLDITRKAINVGKEKVKDLWDMVGAFGIDGVRDIWKSYSDTYDWYQQNPSKHMNPQSPSSLMIRTKAIDRPIDAKEGWGGHAATDYTTGKTFTEINRNLYDNPDLTFGLRDIAGHEASHAAQPNVFKKIGDRIYDMLKPVHKNWDQANKNFPYTPDAKMATYARNERYSKNKLDHMNYTLNTYPKGSGFDQIDSYKFGKEIQARVQEIRNMLNIKERDLTKINFRAQFEGAKLNEKQENRFRNIWTEFSDLFEGFGSMKDPEQGIDVFLKLNKLLPAAVPIGTASMYNQQIKQQPMK